MNETLAVLANSPKLKQKQKSSLMVKVTKGKTKDVTTETFPTSSFQEKQDKNMCTYRLVNEKCTCFIHTFGLPFMRPKECKYLLNIFFFQIFLLNAVSYNQSFFFFYQKKKVCRCCFHKQWRNSPQLTASGNDKISWLLTLTINHYY